MLLKRKLQREELLCNKREPTVRGRIIINIKRRQLKELRCTF